MLECVMDKNEQPISPLMRKLQEALERDMVTASQRPASTTQINNPLKTSASVVTPATRPPPTIVPSPNFTSAAISEGKYIEQTDEPSLPDPAFAEEDLTDEELNANSRSRRGGLILATAVMVAGAAAIAAFMFILSPQQEATGPLPEVRADQPETKGATAVEAPPLRAIEPSPSAPVVAAPPTPTVSMGDVSTELVAPTTDGLSPARKIGTIRIMTDGDKEIKP
jgi:hypothetical protein